MNFDMLITKTITGKAPCAVGLDIGYSELPDEFRDEDKSSSVMRFNRDVIDSVCEYVPAISVNIPALLPYGISVVSDAVSYAKAKEMFVIADAKCSGEPISAKAEAEFYFDVLDVDCVTVSAFYGTAGLAPFFEKCEEADKSMFILARSESGSPQDFQELMAGLRPVYRAICEKTLIWGSKKTGNMGFSNIGIMLGGIPNNMLREFRRTYKKNMFLLTGYDGKKTTAHDLNGAFDMKGLGGIVYITRPITLPEGDGDFCGRVSAAAEEICRDLKLCF